MYSHLCVFIWPQKGAEGRDAGHIAMTFCALLMLLILEDDFSRVHREAVAAELARLQNADGR